MMMMFSVMPPSARALINLGKMLDVMDPPSWRTALVALANATGGGSATRLMRVSPAPGLVCMVQPVIRAMPNRLVNVRATDIESPWVRDAVTGPVSRRADDWAAAPPARPAVRLSSLPRRWGVGGGADARRRLHQGHVDSSW